MFLIHCPHCGEHREEEEFHRMGEGALARPENPDDLDDEAWGEFLYFRKNTRGRYLELWQHTAGCRQFLNIERDTVSYEIYSTSKVGVGS